MFWFEEGSPKSRSFCHLAATIRAPVIPSEAQKSETGLSSLDSSAFIQEKEGRSIQTSHPPKNMFSTC